MARGFPPNPFRPRVRAGQGPPVTPAGCACEELRRALGAAGLGPQPLELVELPGAGYGLAARESLRAGDDVVGVPRAPLALTPEVALRKSVVGAAMERQGVPAWSALAMFLAEVDAGLHAEDEEAPWLATYVAALPREVGGALEWSEIVQSASRDPFTLAPSYVEVLEGSTLAQGARSRLKSAQQSWIELDDLVYAAEAEGMLAKGLISQERLVWAFSILLSRLIRLPALNQEALVPWADMCNHAPGLGGAATFDFDAGSGLVTLRAGRDYQPGEQVFASYGEKSSGDLLCSYGFTSTSRTYEDDVFPLTLGVLADDPLADAKVAVLEEAARKGVGSRFPLRANALPEGALPYAAFVASRPGSAEECQAVAGRTLYAPFGRMGDELVRLGHEELLRAVRACLAAFKTTFEEDKAVCGAWANADSTGAPFVSAAALQDRSAAIAFVKVRERQILLSTENYLRGTLRNGL